MDLKEFFTGYKGKDMPAELQDFNWGAFLLTFIWGIKYRAWITLLAIPLIWIQMPLFLNWILLFVLQLYCGFNGNKWAYQVEYWKKPADFRRTQILWAIAAVLIHIIVPFIILAFVIRFMKKSPDNPIELAQNAQCTLTYKELKKNMPVITSKLMSDREIAQKFAKKYKNSSVENNTVILRQKSGVNYSFTFTKNDNEFCNINKQNCMVQTSYEIPTDTMVFSQCTFYFNTAKDIIPDEETNKALKKGLNLFKYL